MGHCRSPSSSHNRFQGLSNLRTPNPAFDPRLYGATPAPSPSLKHHRVRSSFELTKENEHESLSPANAVLIRPKSSPAASTAVPAATNNGIKSFMAPTISASSKAVSPSPRRKVLGERNHHGSLRSSVESLRSSVESVVSFAAVVLDKPVVHDGLHQGGVEKVSQRQDEAVHAPVDADYAENDSSDPLTPASIAPLDADPSLPPYNPETNFLSPRPRFLFYKPKSRQEMLQLQQEDQLDGASLQSAEEDPERSENSEVAKSMDLAENFEDDKKAATQKAIEATALIDNECDVAHVPKEAPDEADADLSEKPDAEEVYLPDDPPFPADAADAEEETSSSLLSVQEDVKESLFSVLTEPNSVALPAHVPKEAEKPDEADADLNEKRDAEEVYLPDDPPFHAEAADVEEETSSSLLTVQADVNESLFSVLTEPNSVALPAPTEPHPVSLPSPKPRSSSSRTKTLSLVIITVVLACFIVPLMMDASVNSSSFPPFVPFHSHTVKLFERTYAHLQKWASFTEEPGWVHHVNFTASPLLNQDQDFLRDRTQESAGESQLLHTVEMGNEVVAGLNEDISMSGGGKLVNVGVGDVSQSDDSFESHGQVDHTLRLEVKEETGEKFLGEGTTDFKSVSQDGEQGGTALQGETVFHIEQNLQSPAEVQDSGSSSDGLGSTQDVEKPSDSDTATDLVRSLPEETGEKFLGEDTTDFKSLSNDGEQGGPTLQGETAFHIEQNFQSPASVKDSGSPSDGLGSTQDMEKTSDSDTATYLVRSLPEDGKNRQIVVVASSVILALVAILVSIYYIKQKRPPSAAATSVAALSTSNNAGMTSRIPDQSPLPEPIAQFETMQVESGPSEASSSIPMQQSATALLSEFNLTKRFDGEEENIAGQERRAARRESSTTSFGSFTTYEKVSGKKGKSSKNKDEEAMTPVRRSSRIRSQVTSPQEN